MFIGSYGVVFRATKVSEQEYEKEDRPKQYAVKRIFPTINAGFILMEMLLLRILK